MNVGWQIKKENKPNTIGSNMKVIRKYFNDAINDEIAHKLPDPFRKYRLPKAETNRVKLTLEEVTALSDLELTSEQKMYHIRNGWLFAFWNRGVRFQDVALLKWENINRPASL